MVSLNYPFVYSLQTLGSHMGVTGSVAGVCREREHRNESTGCCLLAGGALKGTEKILLRTLNPYPFFSHLLYELTSSTVAYGIQKVPILCFQLSSSPNVPRGPRTLIDLLCIYEVQFQCTQILYGINFHICIWILLCYFIYVILWKSSCWKIINMPNMTIL